MRSVLVICLLVSVSAFTARYGYSQAVPTPIAPRTYSIFHETDDQKSVTITWNSNVTISGINPAGLTVRVAGVPVAPISASSGGTVTTITIPNQILVGESVTVQWAGGSGANAFGPTASVNNRRIACTDFSWQATNTPTPACAPVDPLTQMVFSVKPGARNSSFWDPSKIAGRVNWITQGAAPTSLLTPIETSSTGVPTPNSYYITLDAESIPLPGSSPVGNYIYPANDPVCGYSSYWNIRLQFPATEGETGNCILTSPNQTVVYASHNNDDTGLGADVILQPTDPDTDLVCLGTNVDMTFSDNTDLNCNPTTAPTPVNDATRWVRVVYGSTDLGGGNTATANIPNIHVDGVQVTDANGNLLHTLPDGSPGYIPPTTPFGVPDAFGVVTVPSSVTDPRGILNQITTSTPTGQVVGQRFWVRLDYWNTCNPYDGFGDLANLRRSVENEIEIIDIPTPASPVNKNYCFDENMDSGGNCGAPTGEYFEVTAGSVTGSTEIRWYTSLANANADNAIASPTYGTNCRFLDIDDMGDIPNSVLAGGTYSVWVRYRTTNVTPNNCLSDPVEVQIVKRPRLQFPGGTVITPSVTEICRTQTMTFSLPAGLAENPNPQGGFSTRYNWSVPAGWTIDNPPGDFFKTITATVGAGAASGTNTISVTWEYVIETTDNDRCGDHTLNIAVQVRDNPAITSPPGNQTVCEDGTISFSVTATGEDLTYQWQHDPDGAGALGFANIPSVGGDPFTGEQTSTLTVNTTGTGATLNGDQFRVIVSGFCTPTPVTPVTSPARTLTVQPKVSITTQPVNGPAICVNGTKVFSVVATGQAPITYQWQVDDGGGGGFVNIPNAGGDPYSDETTANLTINTSGTGSMMDSYLYRVLVNSSTCDDPETSNQVSLSIQGPTVTIGEAPTANVCADADLQLTGGEGFLNGSFASRVWTGTYDETGAAPLIVLSAPQLDALLTNGAGGSRRTALNPIFNSAGLGPGKTGVYVFTLTTTDNNGCSNSATVTVNVTQVDAGILYGLTTGTVTDNSLSASICAGTDLFLNGNPSGGSGTYTTHTWIMESQPGGAVGSLSNANIRNPVFNYTTPGTYELSYFVEDNSGCNFNTDPAGSNITIIVNALPAANDQTPAPICSTDAGGNTAIVDLTEAALLNAINNTGTVTVTWFSDVTLATPIGTPGTATVTDATPVYARVTENASPNCFSIAEVTYTVNATPDDPTGAADGVACETDPPATISVDDPGAGNTVLWFDDATLATPAVGVASGSNNKDFTPTVNSTHTYYAVVQSNTGPTNCQSFNSLAVTHSRDLSPTAADADTDGAVNNSTCDPFYTLSANAPAAGETGTWSASGALYYETFAGVDHGKGLEGPVPPNPATHSTPNWSIDVSAGALVNAGDYFKVQNGKFTAQDTDNDGGGQFVEWSSSVINIAAFPGGVDASIDLSQNGSNADEAIDVFYRLDGGGLMPFPTNGSASGAFASMQAQASAIIGATLQLVVRVQANGGAQLVEFDNVIVRPAGAVIPTFDNVNDPVTTVRNLPTGITTLTWTISSQFSACPPTVSTVDITRHVLPVANDLTPDLCEDTFGAADATVTTAYFNSLNDAITGIGGSVGRQVEYFTDAGRTVPIPASFQVSTNDVVYVRVTRTDVSPGCTDESEITFKVNPLPAAANLTPEECENALNSNEIDNADLTTFNAGVANGITLDRTVTWWIDPGVAVDDPSDLVTQILTPTDVDDVVDGERFYAIVENDLTGCLNVGSVEFVIHPLPDNNPIETPDGSTPASYTVCAGTSILLFQVDPALNAGSTFNWVIPQGAGEFVLFGGGGPNDFFVLLQFPVEVNPGLDITVVETSADGCVGNVNTLNIKVDDAPAAPVILGDNNVCINEQNVPYTIGVPVGGSTYTWTVPGTLGSIVSGQGSDQIVVNISTTSGNISVVETNATGCVSPPAVPLSVTVNNKPSMTSAASAELCSDETVSSALTLSADLVGTVFDWEVVAKIGAVVGASVGNTGTGAINQALTNISSSMGQVIYEVTPKIDIDLGAGTEYCPGLPAQTVTIDVHPEPVGQNHAINTCSNVPLNYNIQTANIDVFGNGLPSLFTYTVSSTDNVNVPAEPDRVVASNLPITHNYINTTTANVTVTYTITPAYDHVQGCLGSSFQLTVTVRPEPVGADDAVIVCGENAVGYDLVANIAAGNGLTAGTTFSWVAIDNADVTGESTTPQTGNTISDVITNITTGNEVVTYTVTPISSLGCAGTPFAVDVTVQPTPVGANSTATICSDVPLGINLTTSGASVAAASYTIATNANGLIQGAGTPSAGAGRLANELADDAWTNTGLNPVNVVYTVTPVSADGCPGASFTITVTVNPEPVGANSMIARCSDEAVNVTLSTNIASVAATTYNIVTNANGLTQSAGIASAGNGKAANELVDDVWTNTGLLPVNVVYTITPVSAALCEGNTFTVTVVVNPEPVGANATAEFCSDEVIALNLTTDVASVAAATYDIIVNPNGLIQSSGTSSAGAGKLPNEIADDAWRNIGLVPVDVQYTITPISADGCRGNDFIITATINPEPVGINSSATVCSDEPVGLTLSTLGTAVPAATYNIAVNANGLTQSGGTPSAGVGMPANEIADDEWNNTGLSAVNVVYTITPVSAAPESCAGDPFTITVTINPMPVGNNVPVTRCSDASVGVTLTTSGLSVPATSFDIAIANGGLTQSGGTPSAGSAKAAGEISDDVWRNTGLLPVDVVYTIIPYSAAGCAGAPFTVTVTVDPEAVGANSTETRCSDEVLAINITTSGASVAADNYTIAVNANGLTLSGGTASAGLGKAATEIADDIWRNTGLNSVNVVYTITPVSLAGCFGDPFTITVTINPEPVGANSTLTRCSDEVLGVNLTTNGASVAAATYTIAVNNGGLTLSAGTNSAGASKAANELADDVWRNTGLNPVDVIYTITPVSAAGCPGNDFTVTATINPEPVGADHADTRCSDELINFPLTTSGASVAAATYNISINANGLAFTGTTASAGNGKLANELLDDRWRNTGAIAVDVEYTIIPVSAAGFLGDPMDVVFTIDPEPVLLPTLDRTICSDDAYGVNLTTNGTSVSALTYNITAIVSNGLTASAGAPVVANGQPATVLADDAWTNTGTTSVDVEYTIVPVSAAGCEGDPVVVTMTIDPEPVLSAGLDDVACSDATIGLTLATNGTSVAAANYNITDRVVDPSLATVFAAPLANGVAFNYLANDIYRNTTAGPLTVTYEIVPVGAINGCEGDPVIVTITINPEPVLSAALDDTQCSDLPSGIILDTQLGSVAAATYNITNIVQNGLTASAGLPAIGTGLAANVIANDAWTNTTNAPVNVEYTVVPVSADGCEGNPVVVTLTVNPKPVLSPLLNATVCSELPSGVILNTIGSSVPAATYNIIAINSNGLIASAGAPAVLNGLADNVIADDAWTNTSNVSVNVEYTIVPVSAAGCEGAPVVVTLTIAPQPVLSATLDVTQCSDVASGILLNTNGISVAAASYNITFLNAHGLTASAGSPAVVNGAAANVLANDAWTNTTNAPVDVEYTVVPVSGSGCLGDPVVVIFTVNPEPVLDPALSAIQCSDVVSGITLNTVGTSVAAATYNIVGINSNGLTASAGSPALGSGFAANVIANDAWTNTGNAPVNVQYIVVPVSAAGCAGEPVAVVLTVNPEPVLSPTLNTTQCSDDPTGITLTTNGSSVTATTYNITSIVNNGLTASAGVPVPGTGFPANEIADDAWTNTGTTNVNVQYTIVPVSAAGCLGNPVVVTVTVRPEPILSPGLDATVCSDTPSNIILGSQGGSVAATTFSVLNIDAHGLTATAGSPAPGSSLATNAIADDVWRNTTNASVNVEYTVVPVSAAGCEGDPVVVTLTVDPEPVIVNGLDDNICSDLPVGLTLNTTPTSIAALNYNIISRTVAGTLTPVAVAAVPANGVAANYLAADVFRNTGSTALTVVYVVEPVGLINGCRGDQKTITITIDPEPVVANLDKTVCSDDVVGLTLATNGLSVGALNYNIVSRMPDPSLVTVFGAAVPISGVGTNYLFNDRFTNTTSAPLTVVYTVEPVGTINGCVGDQKIITVTINPEPVVSPVLDKNVCSDNGIALMLNTDGTSVTASGYNIVSRTVDPALTQVIAAAVPANNVAANYLLGDIFRNTTAGALTVTYRVVPIGSINACVGDFRDIVITVDPEPVMAAGLNTAVCSDDPTGLVLNTNGVSVGAASYNIVSRLVDPGLVDVGSAAVPQNAVADNYLAADVFRNTGSLPLTVVYRVIPVGTINGCTGDFIDITVTINPEPVVSTTLDKSVCSDAAIGLVLNTNGASVTAPTYNIVSNNPDALLTPVNTVTVPQAGVTSTYLSGDIFRNTTNAPLDVVYVVQGVGLISGCFGDQRTITITIQPEPVLQPVAPVVCSDLPIGLVLSTTGTSAPAVSYNIVSRTIDPGLTAAPGNALVANGVSDSHLQNDQFTNTGSIDLFVTYRVEPVSADGCKGDQVDVIVTIEPEPVVDPALNTTVCSRDVSGIILDTNGSSIGAATYDITAVVDGSLTGTATQGSGLAANAIENDVFINTTTTPLKVIYTITPNGTNGCIGDARTVELTVRPEPVIDPGLDNTVCSNNVNSVNIANITLGTNGTSVGANIYELVGVTVPGTITADAGNAVVGSTNGVNLIRNDKYSNTTNAPVVVVYEIRATSADGCEGQSEFINLTINPEPIMVPGVANLCSGVASGIIVGPDAGSATITSFELKSILKPAGLVADGGNAALGIHAALPDGTSAFLANDIFTNTTSIPQVVTYTIAPLAGSCRGADQTIQFTVNPAPEVSGTLNRTVCTDDVAGIVLTTTPASAPAASYDIMSITVDAGLVVTSADLTFPRNTADVNEIASDQFSNPTDGPLTVTYDIVPISGSVCRGPVRSVVLTIEPTVKVVPVVVANSVCSNTPIDITLTSPTAPTSGTITYNYTATPSSGLVSGFLPIQNNLPNGHQITDNLVNNDDTPQTVTYRITPVAAGARNGNGCTGDFVDVVITVEPKPKLTVTPNTAAVCEGLPLSFTLTTTTVPSTGNVQFRVVGTPLATGGVTGFSPDGTIFNNNDILADVLSNPTTTAQTVTYTLLPEAPGVTCAGDAVQLIVTVHPAPVVDPESLSEQICSGGNINIELDYDVTNTIGTWTAVADANIQGSSPGAGSLLFQNLFNTSSTPGNVTYTITPQSPAGCLGTPVNIDVIVDPIPNVVATPTAQTICDDGTTNVTLTSAVAGATFTWTVMPSSTNITGAVAGGGNAIAQVISNAGSFAGSVLYQVTPHGPAPTSCAGMPQPVIITVAPPVGGEIITDDVAICLGSSQLVTIMAAGQGPFSMVYNDGTSDVTVNNVPGGYQFQAAPTSTTTYTLVSVTDVNGCQAFPAGETLTITVGDTDASFVVAGASNSCSPFTAQFQYDQVAGTTYSWNWGDGNLDSVYTATTNEPGKLVKHRYINTSPVGDLEVDVRLRTTVDPSQGGCFDTQTRKISVNPTITPAVFPDKTTICSGESVTFFNQTMGASSHRWFYRVQGNAGEEVDVRTTINATFNFTNTSTTNPVIYEVVYRADNGNCPEEVIVPITVYRGAEASFTEVVPEFIGGNATVTFTNTTTPIDGNDFSYEWDFGLDASPATYNGTDAVIEVDYSSPGLREITLTVTNLNAGASGSACANVERKTINILMPPLVAGFTVSPKAGCFPVEVAVTSNTSTGDTFKWQVLDQAGRLSATSTAPMPVFNIVNPGTYDVFLETTNTLTGQVAFAQVNGIEVFENPVASVQARPTTLFIPDTELITFNFSTGANMYHWDFDDGTTSEDFEPKHFYTLEGTYLLTLVAGNDYGDKDIDGDGIMDGHVVCYDTATQQIIARDGGLTKVPNAFTPSKAGPSGGGPGNGTFNDVFLPITRGVAQDDGAFIMQIFDRWGTLIFESRNQNTGWDGYDKNGNLVPAGVYVYKLDLRLADGQRTTQIGDVTVIR